jgi:membrane protease subunit HflK
MPWNEPGNNGNNNQQDPWGGKRNQSPPDLDKVIGDLIKKMRSLFTKKPGGPSNRSWQPSTSRDLGYGLGAVAAVIFLLWFFSGFFIVNPAEQAVILRLGKFSDVVQPGLHWMARFIDTKNTVDVQKIYSFSLEGNFLTKSSEQGDLPNQVVPVDASQKSDSTDQSKNLVNVELNVQYRISDPTAYLYNVVNPDETMQQVAAGALSDVIGQMKLDEVLTTGREMLSSGVFERSKQILAPYKSGLEVVAVTLRRVQAPDQVRTAFSDVNRADQDRATTIQQAQAYASKVVPIAQGGAARIAADANGYRQQVVLKAQASVAKYQAMLQAYQSSPDITRQRLYLDAMQNILQNTSKVLVDVNSGSNLLYLPLDKLMQRPLGQSTTLPNDNTLAPAVTPTQPAATEVASHDDTTTNSTQTTGAEVKNDTN